MHSSPVWSLQVLGPLRIGRSDAANVPFLFGSKGAALLAWLAIRPEHAGPRAALLDMLWNDTPVEQARTAMRQCLFNLRLALGIGNPLLADRERVSLAAQHVLIDVSRFLALASGNRQERLSACGLYRGDFAEELRSTPIFEAWAEGERRKIRNAAVRLLEACASEVCGGAEATVVEQFAHTLLSRDRLHEGCWRALMTLHSRCGLAAKTEAVWQECRQVLRTQAGIEPSAETARLHASLTAAQRLRSRDTLARKRDSPHSSEEAAATAHDHFIRGWQHYFDGSASHNALAREAFEAASALEPGRCDYAVIAAWTFFTDFNYEWNGPPQESYRWACEAARALRVRFPRAGLPHALGGKLAVWRGEWGVALEEFERAKELCPEDAPVWANTADAMLRMGRTAEAMRHIEHAMELNPADRGYFHFVAGSIQYAMHDLDAALANFEAALRRNDRFCVAYGGVAAVQADLGRIEQAREAASRARIWQAVPQLRYAMHTLGPHADPELLGRWRNAWSRNGMLSESSP